MIDDSNDEWTDHWASIHEAAHACVARFFGLSIELATMNYVTIPHRRYSAPDDRDSIERLIVSASGIVATTILVNYHDGGLADAELSRHRLQSLGADYLFVAFLMSHARREATRLVQAHRREIFAVARALREHRTMTHDQIDAAAKSHSGASVAPCDPS